MKFRPSGSMCAGCVHRLRDCSALDFAQMKTIKSDRDGVRVVKCSDYQRGDAAESQPAAAGGAQ